jgi:hypothetical protein
MNNPEVPGWRKGPGAGRPSDYPELSAQDQWAVDRRLGILDAAWCPGCGSTNVNLSGTECRSCGWKS